jgi:hypothetical protein
MLEARSRIYSRKYKDGAVELEAEVPESLARRMKEFVIPDFQPIQISEPLSETIKRDRR